MGFNCLKARDTLPGGSLLFTTKFPEIPDIYSIRGIWPQQPYHCPASSNTPPPISTNEIFGVYWTRQVRNVPLKATITYFVQI